MSELKNIVKHAVEGNYADFEKDFSNILKQRLEPKIKEKIQEIEQSLFQVSKNSNTE
jgi:hypothetical protein